MSLSYYIFKFREKKLHFNLGVFFLLLIHLVGFLGLSFSEFRTTFQNLTPLNLLLSALVLLIFHKDHSLNFYLFCLITFFVGYFVEVLGIQTGSVFGNYQYGSALGLKIWETPLIIGLNWLLLIYITGIISNKLNINFFLQALFATFLMLLLDFLIEPVAIKLDFWKWETEKIPFQNYLAWGIISYILLIIFYLFPFKKNNSLAGALYIILFFFFFLTGFFV